MPHEYLMKEYELCFAQLRFYDKRQESVLKYMLSLTSAVATAEFAAYKLLGATAGFFECEALLSGLVFVATLLLFLAMLQNRWYFVFVARQLNAIRGYLMRVAAGGFKENQLWTTDRPPLNPFSVHTFMLLGAALISSLFAGASAYAIQPAFGGVPCSETGAVTFLIVFVLEVWVGMKYLASSDPKATGQGNPPQESKRR